MSLDNIKPMTDSKSWFLPSALALRRHCSKGRNTVLSVSDDSGGGILIWDGRSGVGKGFISAIARPALPTTSCCNRSFFGSTDQSELLISHPPSSFHPLLIAQPSVDSVSNCCSGLGLSGLRPLECFDDPVRSWPDFEGELNDWFVKFWSATDDTQGSDGSGSADTTVGLVFGVIAVLGVARKRSVDMEAAIPEDICGGGGFCVGIRGDIGGEVEKVLTIRRRNWSAQVRHTEWVCCATCFVARYAGPWLTSYADHWYWCWASLLFDIQYVCVPVEDTGCSWWC